MPELPEVEVTRRSLEPHLMGRAVESVVVRETRFRVPLPKARIQRTLRGVMVEGLRRRSKYLFIDMANGRTLIIHLGMSGRLRYVSRDEEAEAHEHVVFRLDGGHDLRFRDPRRFGLVLLEPTEGLEDHALLRHLGPEPLEDQFSLDYLVERARGRSAPIKAFLMDARNVVGVGNIYVCEALWRAGVHPRRAAGRIGRERMARLHDAVQEVLQEAIAQGGTTLNDFADAAGEPGYFVVRLAAYGREGEPCTRCGTPIRRIVMSNRSTFYCPRCQR